MTLLLLLACIDKSIGLDTADSGEAAFLDSADTADTAPPTVRATPYLGLAAATTPGSLASTCVMRVEVVEAASGAPVVSAELAPQGRDWSGVALPAGVQLKATATATACTGRADPAPFTSGTFSGEDGLFVVFWYTSVNLGYDTLAEGAESGDFMPASVQLTFVEGTTPEAITALAGSNGSTAVDQGDGSWVFALSDTRRPIGEVLSAVSAAPEVRTASPVWVTEPSWW